MEAGSSSSSSATPVQQGNYHYEVFLSFRGEDTRRTFTDHLYTDLVDKGIHTFRDDEELPKGGAIKPELLKAINQSKVSIPILSKGYASSKWCLMELTHMVKCMEAGNQKILPVFYHVKPHQVRHQEGEYGEAFAKHQKAHPSMIAEWITALDTVGRLKGWHLDDEGYEGSLRSNVVLEVFEELKKYHHIDITDNLVGIDDHVDEIMDVLDIDVADVRIGGIWGMAGSGKTTIAKFIYNRLMHKFDYCSFLSDISEASKSKGMELLKAQLVSDVLGHQSEKFFDMRAGKYLLRQRFHNKKVLVVLDDVDQAKQLHGLLQIICSVLAGSRIIITTRNKSVLEAEPDKADWIYEVKEMDEENALLLFCKHAFKQNVMLPAYDNLSGEIVKAIGGVPLAIEVVASYLSSHLKNKAVWEEELGRLKCHPEIQETLRVGTDSLNYEEREIFLDIACLFHGMDGEIPEPIWRALEFYPVRSIKNLLAKSLIKLTEGNKLWMHNLLKYLGREIVRAENRDEPGERSRLWSSEDGLQVLDDEEGTKKVKAICLPRSTELEQRHFSGKKFRKLSRLLFLDLGYANLNVGFESGSSKLKWIGWHGVGQSQLCISPGLHLKDLAVLDLSESSIGENWGGWNLIQEAKKLEVINLKSCQQLRSTHFNSFLPLKRFILEDCHELSVVHSSIGLLTALKSLNLKNCWRLERLPDELGSLLVLTELVIDKIPIESLPEGMANLETLSAKSCEYLREISLSDYESLKELNLSHTPIVHFSFSSRQPRNLQELDISHSLLSSFPPVMELQKLEVINASACHSLEGEVPTELGRLISLRILRLDSTRIASIPESIRDLRHLEVLDLGHSECERTLPDLPSSLVSLIVTCRSSVTVIPNLSDLINLKELEFLHCSKLDRLPKEIKRLNKLRRLKLQSTSIVALPEEIGELCQLRELIMLDCDRVESLPELPSGLRRLKISQCSLKVLPNLSRLQMLKRLVLIDCVRLRNIQGLDELELLEELKIKTCRSFEVLTNLSRLQKLKKLVLSSIVLLKVIQGLSELEWLEELTIEDCSSLKVLPNLSRLQKLKRLVVSSCVVKVIHGLAELKWLEELHIESCDSLETFPDLSRLHKLKSLVVRLCLHLTVIQGLGELEWLEELRLEYCYSFEALPNMSRLRKLRILVLSCCERHIVIQGLGELEWLEELRLNCFYSLETLPNLCMMQKLRILVLSYCKQLKVIQGVSELEQLEELHLEHCVSLETLPNLSRLKELKRLVVSSSVRLLRVIQGLGELERLEELRLEYFTSLKSLPNLLKLQRLKKVHLFSCKQLEDIGGLLMLENLEHIQISYCPLLEDVAPPPFGVILR